MRPSHWIPVQPGPALGSTAGCPSHAPGQALSLLPGVLGSKGRHGVSGGGRGIIWGAGNAIVLGQGKGAYFPTSLLCVQD